MRLSTAIKRKYQDQGIPVFRALQEDCMIRLTVPANTPHLKDEVKRSEARAIIGPALKTKIWVWVWAGLPEWYDDIPGANFAEKVNAL
jgi:hypothetical protein